MVNMQLATILSKIPIFSFGMSLLGNAQERLRSTLSPKAILAVPGDSPCHYVGDPRNNVLSIEALDLVPNPPVE